MKRFLLSVAIVAVLWGLMVRYNPPSWLDIVILVGVGVAYIIGFGQMLVFRRVWPAHATGIFWTAVADATFYLSLGLSKLFATHTPPWAFDLVRAAFIVGAPLFAIGTIRYIQQAREESLPDDLPTGLP